MISNIHFDDVLTDWLSKRTVYFFCYDKNILFRIMETCSPCFLPFYFSKYLSLLYASFFWVGGGGDFAPKKQL